MGSRIRQILAGAITVAALIAGNSASAEPIEAVYSFDVQNSVVMLKALDSIMTSPDTKGRKAALWAVEFDGDDPKTHVLVTEFDDYAAYERMSAKRRGSPDWLRYLLATRDAAELTSNLLVIQRYARGGGWRNHGALVAYIMTITDPVAYRAEFAKLFDASENPGSVRLMEVRAGGGGVTHVALISAPGFAALNSYLDRFLSSDAYRSFAQSVRPYRSIQTVTMYRRVKTWED